ncbi:MAG: acyltransferase [Kofleriaceae bacterium]
MNRRPELDWLRVVAIAILHAFHVGMMFNTWDFHLKNPDPLPVLEVPMSFLHVVRMPLLMVIAGIGTAIALQRRSVGRFALDRTKRLLLPLVFGMLVIVPPQIYIERLAHGEIHAGYLAFYRTVFELRPYPAGSFSWHHLWFVAYLFLYCIAALPLFAGLATAPGRRLLGWLDRAWARGWVFALFVPLALERIALGAHPETHALFNDPNTLAYYGLLFLSGHLVGRSHTVWPHLVARRWRYLLVLCVLLAVMLPPNLYPSPFEELGTAATVWCVALNAFAWTRWYFQRPAARVPSWLDHAQQLSYPFYILHQTVILAAGWAWLSIEMGPWSRFAAVLISSFVATWALCETVARISLVRPLFGMGPRRVVSPRLAQVA